MTRTRLDSGAARGHGQRQSPQCASARPVTATAAATSPVPHAATAAIAAAVREQLHQRTAGSSRRECLQSHHSQSSAQRAPPAASRPRAQLRPVPGPGLTQAVRSAAASASLRGRLRPRMPPSNSQRSTPRTDGDHCDATAVCTQMLITLGVIALADLQRTRSAQLDGSQATRPHSSTAHTHTPRFATWRRCPCRVDPCRARQRQDAESSYT